MSLAITLEGKKGLVLGLANAHSIAFGCAEAFAAAGADLLLCYQDARTEAEASAAAAQLGGFPAVACDVREENQLQTLFAQAAERWGRLDFVLHSIAFAPRADLHGRVVDCSREGFLKAMDISCHSFLRVAKLAEPLMAEGGSLLTVSYMGSSEVVEHYGLMGPVKAALESATRYMAAELGPKQIRVNALSPGPIPTRAASGIASFDALLGHAVEKSALRRIVDLGDIGSFAAFLASDLGKNITGGVHVIDAGYAIMD